jgi:hypothetical protein
MSKNKDMDANAYWRENKDEFVAEIFNDKELIKSLKNDKKGTKKENIFKRLFNYIVSFISGKKEGSKEFDNTYDMLLDVILPNESEFGKTEASSNGKEVLNERKPKQSEARMKTVDFKKPDKDFDVSDILSRGVTDSNAWTAALIQSGFDIAKPWSTSVAAEFHESMKDNELYMNAYNTVAKGYGDVTSTGAFKRLKQYTWGDPKIETALRQLGAEDMNTRKEMVEIMTTQTQQFENRIEKAGYNTPEKLEQFYDVVATSGLYGVSQTGMLKRILDGDISLDDAIAEAESNLSKDLVEKADIMASLYMEDPVKGVKTPANLTSIGLLRGDKRYYQMEELIGLKALSKREGALDFVKDMHEKNYDLFAETMRLTALIKSLDTQIHSVKHGKHGILDQDVSRGNLIDDVGRYNYDIVPLKRGEYGIKFKKEDGWEVLRAPRKGELGLVKKRSTDKMQDGMGTINYIKTGITVDPVLATSGTYANGTYTTSPLDSNNAETRYAISLTADEKRKLHIYRDPAKSLMRAYAHKQRVLSTLKLRNFITDSLSREYATTKDVVKEVESLIDEKEHPLFVSYPGADKIEFTEKNFSKKILDEYQLVDSTLLSDVGGYNTRFQLVRKDVAEVLQGYRERGIFKNETANRVLDGIKDGIRQGKTILIILNIPKIAVDFTSGMGLAMAKGASFEEAFKYSMEAVKGSSRLTKILNERSQNAFELAGYKVLSNPSDAEKAKLKQLEKRAKELDKRLRADPFSPAYFNGFMQSLGTDIMSRDKDSAQGLQVSMEDLISKITKSTDKDGKETFTAFNEAVKTFANAGGDNFNVSYIYNALADMIGKDGADASSIMREMANDMNAIRSKEDMTKYIAELLASPNSALVRLGSAMTVYADLLPRWTIYRHNINKGMSEEEAVNDALSALPNYMFGMPSEMKFLSDIYVTPFPSFYTRIQKTIFALATRSPVSMGSQMIMADMLNEQFGVSGTAMTSAFLLNKVDNGSLFSNPFELPFIPYSMMFGN